MEATQQLEFDAQGVPIHATEYDAQGIPIGAPQLPSSKPQPLSPMTVTPQTANDMFKAGVHAKILGVTPGAAYESKDEIDQAMRERGGNYDDGKLDDTFANDIKAGYQSSVLGLTNRKQLPQEVRNPGFVDKFVSGISQLVSDIPFMVLGGAAGGAAGSEVPIVGNAIGAGAGAFALPAFAREALVQGIKKGDVKSFSDIMRRFAAATWAGTKGAVVGAATTAAGGLPVGGVIAKSGLATTAVKGLYQATAMTTAADLLEGKVPTASDFAGNAAAIIPLNLILHGLPMKAPEAKQGTMDVYAKDGTTPQETVQRLNAQPPVKPDLSEGLKPAINLGEGHIEGDTAESHAYLSERVLAKRAVSMDALEKDPAKADRVLENPQIHDQDVIDRAWELKKAEVESGDTDDTGGTAKQLQEASSSQSDASQPLPLRNPDTGEWVANPDSDTNSRKTDSSSSSAGQESGGASGETRASAQRDGEGSSGQTSGEDSSTGNKSYESVPLKQVKPIRIEDLYDRSQMKSGRGFVTPDGEFLTRSEARKWMKDNEPDTHDLWLESQDGDKQAELRTQDYAEARNRAQGRNLAEGDSTIAGVDPQNAQRLAAARTGLNKIKAGLSSTGYGREVIRVLFSGQLDTRVAEATQLRDVIGKEVPKYQQDEGVTIMRDYKDNPEGLAAKLEKYRTGDSERLKKLIPSIEQAMNPTPGMLEADQKLTDYFTATLNEGQQLGILESSIDPSRYSPHVYTRILDGEKPISGKGGPMSKSTPFGKERKYDTVLDALETGRLDAGALRATDSLSIYAERHATAVATKLLSTELKNSELGKEGSKNDHPDGWKLLPGTDTYVTPDTWEALKPLFESGLKDTGFAPILKVQGYVKALELGLSLFHVKALNVTAFNNMSLADFTKSVASDVNHPEFLKMEREWAADGLVTSKTSTPYEAYEGLRKSSLEEPTGLARLKDNAIVKMADAAFKKTTEYTFDVVQRKFKVLDASLKVAGWMADHPEATDEDLFAARRSIAKEVNSAYGGLNWNVLGTGKTVRDVSRLFLLAPDWTFSNVLTAKYSFEGGPAGSAARMFWAKSFATGFAMTAAVSIAIGGRYDPTDIKHIDQVYLGKDEKGKDMYANWFFAGAPKDAITLAKRSASDSPLAGTAEFIVSKASPALGLLGDVAYNKKGGSNIPVRNTKDTGLEQTGEVLKYGAGRVVPITGVSAVKTVSDALSDPNHEYSYKDLLELAADSLGAQTTHSAPGGGASKTSSTQRFQKAGGKSRFTVRKR